VSPPRTRPGDIRVEINAKNIHNLFGPREQNESLYLLLKAATNHHVQGAWGTGEV